MLSSNFFRMPYAPGGGGIQPRPYSFIDDVRGANHDLSDEMAQYQDHQNDLATKLAMMRDTASPELYSALGDIYGSNPRMAGLFQAPHAADILREARNPQAPIILGGDPSQVDPAKITAAGNAIMQPQAAPSSPMASNLATALGLVRPAQAAPVSPTLAAAAGAVPTPSEGSPFARMIPTLGKVQAAQNTLLGKNNPMAAPVAEAASNIGSRPDTNMDVLANTSGPIAGRAWASAQDQLSSALDQKFSKMNVSELAALLNGFKANTAVTEMERKTLKDKGSEAVGEGRALNATNVARAGASVGAGSKAVDHRVAGVKAKMDSTNAQIKTLQTQLAAKMKDPMHFSKTWAATNIAPIQAQITAYNAALDAYKAQMDTVSGVE